MPGLLPRTSTTADESFECSSGSSGFVKIKEIPLMLMRCLNAAGDANGEIKKTGYPALMIPRIESK